MTYVSQIEAAVMELERRVAVLEKTRPRRRYGKAERGEMLARHMYGPELFELVEDQWGEETMGELNLDDDPALKSLVSLMAQNIYKMRGQVYAYEDECEPVEDLIAEALQIIFSPESNGV